MPCAGIVCVESLASTCKYLSDSMFTGLPSSFIVSITRSGLVAANFNESFVVFLIAMIAREYGYPTTGTDTCDSLRPLEGRVHCLNSSGCFITCCKAPRMYVTASDSFLVFVSSVGEAGLLIFGSSTDLSGLGGSGGEAGGEGLGGGFFLVF